MKNLILTFAIIIPLVILSSRLNAIDSSQGNHNTLLLSGFDPDLKNAIPPSPPGRFQAVCRVRPGYCVVEGNGVIAPGTPCHCADYAGQTW